ncbi:dihydroxy-acid dehydratase domain-containing protein [Paenibacillus koleovorans]|uniref:dihydroxy-acid dehydratase domain-containing protein n=1 Tax=Paenibacillus koleovorans TaxID=121608 RepID=UPI000FD779FD|nr:dihydroxy-acid dehydratase [Paenibacillus koleovorans]
MSAAYPNIESLINPYRDTVLSKSNEPITVAGLLDRAKQTLGAEYDGAKPDWTLERIFDRLEDNAPRIAIIGGSADHPAHIMDYRTIAYAALRIWRNGGVPFQFSTPVMCDGTAQDNQGMSYSLQSRNAVAQMVANQMEAHSYHGAFVIQGCDKQPLGVVSALAHVDRVRSRRGEAPLFATFAPAHVLHGGAYPEELLPDLEELAGKAERAGAQDIAEDIRDTVAYVLVCSTNTSFQGVFERARRRGLLTHEQHKALEKRLAVSTCDAQGGVCAFNGTGNSSRHLVAGLGLVHPALELLTQPPTAAQVYEAVDAFAAMINKPKYRILHLMAANIRNAIRIHSSSGGSTNLLMHTVAAMLYGGFRFSLREYDRLRREFPVPDLLDYSLTEGRDIFTLAQQCCSGDSRGMETLFHELLRHGVPMDTEAPTVTGTTWGERLNDGRRGGLSADRAPRDRVILSSPRRPFSGVDVLNGNFFESAVVKISGMPTPQLDSFDKKVNFVLYFHNEEEANAHLLDPALLDRLKRDRILPRDRLLAALRHNAPDRFAELELADNDNLFDAMAASGALKLAVVISGQGPAAFGMPEMYTPMQYINANRQLRKLVTVISDGRYSGVTLGAAVGHMTPEAFSGGGMLYLQTGDMLYLDLRGKRIDFIHPEALLLGEVQSVNWQEVRGERSALGEERRQAIAERRRRIATANRLTGHTDAACGVVPQEVYDDAEEDYLPLLNRGGTVC